MLSWNLARAGLKTIVVMAGGCALQANPHIVSRDLEAVPLNLLPGEAQVRASTELDLRT